MVIRLVLLYSLSLALSFVPNSVATRADVLDQDRLGTNFIAKPFCLSGAIRRSSADQSTSLYARSCHELWYQRNAILWAAGYCFAESRAVRVFGNAACGYDRRYEVPLTGGDSLLIGLLEQAETAKGCD
jgi:hypothetical protein